MQPTDLHTKLPPSPPSEVPKIFWHLAPTEGHVILKPEEDPAEQRGIYTPVGYRQQYPQVGRVCARGRLREDILNGDLALIEVEGGDVARTYTQVFEVLFKDGQTALFEPDVEPVVREVVEDYRRNPSDSDKRIRMLALEGEGFSFLASDVFSYQWREVSSPDFTLQYPVHVRMFHLWNGVKMQLYYVVHEDHILGVLR